MEAALHDFERHGGQRLLLVHSPYEDLQAVRMRDFRPGFQRTLQLADQARALSTVEIQVALGPYPVELLSLAAALGLSDAVEVMKAGLETAAQEVTEGRAVALGEVGRPHFAVEEALWQASNELIDFGMRLAKEVDCPIILHTEEGTPEVLAELARRADTAGLPRERVVKHYAGPWVSESETGGVFPSVLARKDWVAEAAQKGRRFLLETDYLDDPQRPGAVLGLATVPRRSAALLKGGLLTREDLHTIHGANIETVYGGRFTA